jgi:hypothetical protein
MAPKKGRITIEGLHAAAAKAAEVEVKSLPSEGKGLALTCTFLAVCDCNGRLLPDAAPTCRNHGLFQWRIEGDGLSETSNSTVRCDHALAENRNIPLPDSWRFALRCQGLQTIANKSAQVLAARSGLEALECHVLGVAKPSPSMTGLDRAPGTEVALREPNTDTKLSVLLCALVRDNVWVCFTPNGIQPPAGGSNYLDGLIVKDIISEAWCAEPARKKSKARARNGELCTWATLHTSTWSFTLALASFMAEEHRARAEHRALDVSVAGQGFESDVWRWPPNSGNSILAVVWTWQRSGEQRFEFARVRLDHVFARQGMPAPQNSDADGSLYDRLLRAADNEGELGKAPCKYLGLDCGGFFEPDPAKWPAAAYQACLGKMKASVTFLWEHVTQGGQPLRASISANDLLHHNRDIPHNPLGRGAPYGLAFTSDFLTAVAGNVLPGICYKGVCYDAERPEITATLPNGGVNIQDESIFWALPSGAVRCWSLRELVETRPDELLPEDSEAAYSSVAAELGYDVLGCGSDADILQLREEPGTLAERRWCQIAWTMPPDEAHSCWFLVNPAEPDVAKPPKLLCRSLTCVRLELQNARVASSAKLRRAWESRLEDNARAVESLLDNAALWRRVNGPDPELLLQPTEALLVAAHAAAAAAVAWSDATAGAHGLDSYSAEVKRAADKAASLFLGRHSARAFQHHAASAVRRTHENGGFALESPGGRNGAAEAEAGRGEGRSPRGRGRKRSAPLRRRRRTSTDWIWMNSSGDPAASRAAGCAVWQWRLRSLSTKCGYCSSCITTTFTWHLGGAQTRPPRRGGLQGVVVNMLYSELAPMFNAASSTRGCSFLLPSRRSCADHRMSSAGTR